MAKKINITPTTDVNFDSNLTYEDNFAKWLTEMVEFWPKNYTGCTFEITKVGTETEGLSANIKSTPKKGVNFDCNSSLEKDLKSVQDNKKITVEKKASELSTIFTVTWKKEGGSTTKKEKDKSKEEKSKEEKSTDTSDSKEGKSYDRVFGNLGQKLVQAALTGTQKAAGTVQKTAEVQQSHYINDKKLLEEIQRIKKLLK
jgi:hypothetical protein